MKLTKCYVSSFGKLKNYTYDFSSGVNEFKEDNGWGKSTLATFIKAMFYGLNGTGKRSVTDNERMKYKPWNSTEKFGGFVEFSWGGKEYKIERYFGNKDSDDTVVLTDLSTGKSYPNQESLGKRIFEIDEDGYLSTTYFSQKDFQIKSNTSITAKYNSVCEIHDSVAFDKALQKIEEKAKTYKYRGDKGLIPDSKRLQAQISEEIERVELSLDAVKNLKNDTTELENQTLTLKNKANKLTEQIALSAESQALAVKKARYDELEKEYKELSAIRSESDKLLGGKKITDEEISALSECVKETVKISSAEALISEEVNNLENEIEKRKKEIPSKKAVSLTAIFAVIFLVAGVVTLTINPIFGVIGFVLCAVFTVWFAMLFISTKKNDKVSVFLSMLQGKNMQLADYRSLRLEYVNTIDTFFSGMNFGDECDYSVKLELVKSAVLKRKQAESRIKIVLEDLEKLKPFAIRYVKDSASGIDAESLKEILRSVQNEYSIKANELATKRAAINRYEEYAERLAELESKKCEVAENLENYKEDFEILNLTEQYLKKADENLKTKYRAPLQESLNKYLKLIDGEKTAHIDIDLNVTVEENSGEKSTEYYSKGYQNLFEICKRFALIDVLFTAEKPFIILDDPFYNLDDEKLDQSKDLVKKLSEEYQILYFVCHESRRI